MKRTDEARKWMAQALPMLVQSTQHMLVSQCKAVTCLIHAFRVCGYGTTGTQETDPDTEQEDRDEAVKLQSKL